MPVFQPDLAMQRTANRGKIDFKNLKKAGGDTGITEPDNFAIILKAVVKYNSNEYTGAPVLLKVRTLHSTSSPAHMRTPQIAPHLGVLSPCAEAFLSAPARVRSQAIYVGAHLTHLNSSPLQHALNVSVGGTRSLWRVFAASGASPPPPVCFL